MRYHKPMHRNDVIKMMAPRFGSEALAHVWYRLAPLPGFDGRTAMQLMNDGEAQQVLDYLGPVDAGVYAC
ncbi:antitoxin Xre/MbcA/ParS toxin-binding domain-containing protein [Sulfitobacter dubius]|uniref:antitoxin Xre/MbcA/ParS toxin-binding domain-containing protein n=1 Tax=Sulfitobacter dubius TaxID=218673 RepID=UPI000B8310A6